MKMVLSLFALANAFAIGMQVALPEPMGPVVILNVVGMAACFAVREAKDLV